MKRVISILLTITILLALIPTISFAAMGDYDGNITGATWYWPLHGYSSTSSAYSMITSSYGYRGGSYNGYHRGVDIGASKGTSVYPTRKGTVSEIHNSTSGSYGRYVIINHNDGYFSIYMHLSRIDVSEKGQSVGVNTQIGAVGGSGYNSETAYANHLHMGIHYGSSFSFDCSVNPCPSGYTRIGNSLQASAGGYPIGSASISYSVNLEIETPPDTEAPTITDGEIAVKNLSGDSFTVECNMDDNVGVVSAWINVWGPGGNKGYRVPASNGTFSIEIKTSDYGGAGYYSVHIYAEDAAGNSSEGAYKPDIYAVNTYTIIYDANGGTGAPSSQKKIQGQDTNLSTVQPTRDGYIFWGWATSPDASMSRWAVGENFSYDGDITLYAFWKIKTYTITYDANGGINPPSTQTKIHGQDINLSSLQPTREDYIFWGWATSPDASMSRWAVGENFSYDGDVTLYAYWKPKYYTITYDANGGTGAPSSQIKTYGQNTNLSIVQPVRDGFTFWGWATSPDASMSRWAAGEIFSYDGDITLYAFWLPNYTITYDANGGMGAPAPQNKIHGQDTNLSNTQPTRAGYIFWGWATSPDASMSRWAVGENFSYDGDVTLYAYWKVSDPYIESQVNASGSQFNVISNIYNIEGDYTIIVAGYNDNRLVDIVQTTQGVSATLNGDIDEIKVMVWDNLSRLVPLCDAEVIPSSEWQTE